MDRPTNPAPLARRAILPRRPSLPGCLYRPLAWAAIAICLVPAGAEAVERLGEEARPLAQRVTLELDPAEDEYRGEVTIDLELAGEAAAVRLHARALVVADARLETGGGPVLPLTPVLGREDVLALVGSRPLPPGRHRLVVPFRGAYNRQGVALYKTEIAGAPYLFTQFEAADARGAFPCFDEPSFKLPYELVLTLPAGFDAVANSPIAAESAAPDGRHTVRFRPTPPLPSYLIALAVGTFDFVSVPGTSIPARVVAPRGMGGPLAAVAVETTPPLLAALEAWFDERYPFEKLDLIGIPEYWFGAMENPGAITYSADILLAGAQAGVGERRRLARVTAHELAHMWFGDLVTMAWWDDLWLNESFADWLGDKIADRAFPELGIARDQMGNIENVQVADARPSATAIRLADATPQTAMQTVGVAYNKGKAVLAMVEGWLGEEAFRQGVLAYVRSHAWGSASAPDLWTALGRAAGREVAPVLRGFLEQPGLPLLTAVPVGGARVRLSQRRYTTAGVELPALSWQIPVRITAGDGRHTVEQALLLDQPETTVELAGLERVDWLLPNAGAAGYYRWQLPADRLRRLTATATERLTVAERVAVVGNASALLAAGDLDAAGYLDLLSRAARDPEPAVLALVLAKLNGLREPLVSERDTPGWRRYVRESFAAALARIGRQPLPAESPEAALLRPELLELLGEEGGDAEVLAWARDLAPALATGGAVVDPALRPVALNLAARDGGRDLFDAYRARFAATADPVERSTFLGALGSFGDPERVDDALDLIAAGALRPDEVGALLGTVSRRPENRDRLLAWAMAHYAVLAAALPPEFRAFLPFVGGGCDRARLERSNAFFGAPERAAPGVERIMRQVGEQVDDCLALRAREGEAAGRYLAAFAVP